MMGHFSKARTSPKQVLREFHVSKDAVVPIGTTIYAEHFKPGQFLDVRGKSKGKGFAGVMKRYGFGGGNASHGQSVSTQRFKTFVKFTFLKKHIDHLDQRE